MKVVDGERKVGHEDVDERAVQLGNGEDDIVTGGPD